MFGGLEMKAPVAQQQEQQEQQQVNNNTGQSSSEGQEGSVQSAFSFLSNNTTSETDNNTMASTSTAATTIGGENKIMDASNSYNLGLNELLGLGPIQDTATATKTNTSTNTTGEEKESGFNFLNIEKEETSPEAIVPIISSSQPPNTSGFSFMASSTEKEEPPVSSQLPHLPPASGFSFMGSANAVPATNHALTAAPPAPSNSFTPQASPVIKAKKNIKKTRRGKKIGYSHDTSTAIAIPEAQYLPPSNDNSAPTLEQTHNEQEDPKQKSEEARQRAEQFLSEKLKEQQQTQPPAVLGVNYNSTAEDDPSRKSPTVAQAEAAAEEAKALKSSGNNSRFSEGMAGFFAKTRKNFTFNKNDEKNASDKAAHSSQWTSESVHSYNSSSHSDQSSHHYQHQQPTTATNYDEEEEDDDYTQDAKAIAISEEKRLQKLRQEAEKVERKARERRLSAKMQLEETKVLEEDNRRKEEERIKNMTAKDKFDVLIDGFRSEIDSLMLEVTELRKQRKELNIEKQETIQKDKLASQFLSQTHQKQSIAIDNEDFDFADRLTSIITQKEQQKKELTEILYQLKEASTELECNETQALQCILQSFSDLKIKLQEFYTIEDKQEKGDSTDTLEKFAATFKRLSAEQDRLNNELKHIERDEGIVLEETKELEDTIHSETKDIDLVRSSTNEKLSTLQEEIQCLKEQLAIKEAEEKILQSELTNHNTEIDIIRSKFHRQLTRLSKKETSLADNRYDWETEKEAMTLSRKKHEAEVATHSEALLAYENLMKGVKNEIEVVGRWKEIIHDKMNITFKSDGEDDDEEEELLALTSDLVKCQAAVEDAEDIVNAAQDTLDNLHKEKETIQTLLPILESEKKTAAAKRDFKTASKASKELKEALLKLKQCEEEMEHKAKDCLDDAFVEKERLLEELKLKRSLFLDKEQSQAVNKMIQLGTQISKLEDFKKEFTEDVSSNDDSCSVSAVGVDILEKEIFALKAVGEVLGAKFGGWEEMLQAGNDDVTDDKNVVDIIEESDETNNFNESDEVKEEELEIVTKEEEVEEELVNNTSGNEEKTNEEIQEELLQFHEQLSELESKLDHAVEEEEFDTAADIDDSINALKNDIEELEDKLK